MGVSGMYNLDAPCREAGIKVGWYDLRDILFLEYLNVIGE